MSMAICACKERCLGESPCVEIELRGKWQMKVVADGVSRRSRRGSEDKYHTSQRLWSRADEAQSKLFHLKFHSRFPRARSPARF